MRRLLLLSVSAGAGHSRAAEALRAEAQASFPKVDAKHIDLMTLVPQSFRALYANYYIKIVEHHPSVWAYLYHATDRMPRDAVFAKTRRAIERLNTRKLHDLLREFAPDHIICTHFLPAELLAHDIRRGRVAPPVWVQVTDFDLHRMWVQSGMRGYFAASDEIAFRMVARGIPSDSVHVTGIPIMPIFSRRFDRDECARELGIAPDKITLLLMTGGAGLAGGDLMVERLLGLPDDFQIVALAGRNQQLLGRYRSLAAAHPGRLLALAYTSTIERVMACADLAVTKPGGLTVSECLAVGLPMVLISPIPGQEERNADYLMEHGIAVKAQDMVALEFKIGQLVKEPERLKHMRQNMRGLGRPDAAHAVLSRVLGNGG
ncbi:MAG TPA: glycosyltransferase [Candidatus Binatia bacterium]|jgi:processive 1,2-diacylglycerol beta-glucosyltransferase|nr:glycosyltransferase [Candidatus Binatia bacterium]